MIAQDISHYRLIYQRWVDLINTDLQNYSKMFISTRKDILLFYTTRYDYAYSEARREPVYNGAQTAHEDCEIRQNASKNNHEGKHSACRGQKRVEPHDSSKSSIGLQHICHNSSKSPGLLWGEGARCHIEQEEAGYTSCCLQGDRRRGSTHYSTYMYRSSQGICKMDAETSCRQVGEVGLCRLDLTYTGRSNPKKRIQASPEEMLVHPLEKQRIIRGRYGGCVRGI